MVLRGASQQAMEERLWEQLANEEDNVDLACCKIDIWLRPDEYVFPEIRMTINHNPLPSPIRFYRN
jgi:hypothetical protein